MISSALAQLMSRPTWTCHSHGGHSCLITIGRSPDAPDSVWTCWDLLPASPSMHVSVQPHLRVRTALAPTEVFISLGFFWTTYSANLVFLKHNTASGDLWIQMTTCGTRIHLGFSISVRFYWTAHSPDFNE